MINLSKKAFYFLCLFFLLAMFGFAALKTNSYPVENGLLVIYKTSAPLVLNNVHNRVITGLSIKGNAKDCIKLTNCSAITIKNCLFYTSKMNGVQILNSKSITIAGCYFENTVTGVYAYKSTGVIITGNQFKNMMGPIPKGQMVQFNEVYGAGNRVNFNKCQNMARAGQPEDAINMYRANGTAESPIQVTGNQIRGGGPSKTGGGIMLGDNGGSYITAKNNILVNPGHYGIAIAGGSHMRIINNKIYGRRQDFTNVGIYIWNQHASACAMNTVSENQVNFINAKREANPCWNNGNCGKVAGWETNQWGAPITDKILPANIIKDVNIRGL